jgi:NodT family efflux transporter outer membrane factor (OMF) lipoprotein
MSSFGCFGPLGAGLLWVCVATLNACTVGPDFVRPAAVDVQRYTAEPTSTTTFKADGLAQRLVPGTDLSPAWWQLFKSPQLDATVQQALTNNPTLRAAEANLRQSQENLRAGDAVFVPWLDAGIGGARARSAPIQQGSQAPSTVFNVVTLSGVISYPLDVFGGERRTVEGLQAQVDYQRFIEKAAYLTLSANVVETCIARAAYFAQIKATEQLIDLERVQLQVIEAQVRVGVLPFSNLLSQRSLIASNQALLAPLEQKVSQASHLLALLQGDVPSRATLPEIELGGLALPADLPLSLPSNLVRQRPDILSAEAQLHVASANIGVATAALFPSFTLSASYGTVGSSLGDLATAGGRFWSFGPSMLAPLFHAGSLHAQRRGAVDAYEAQESNYRQTVLAAFAQVADALKALEHDAQSLQAQSDSQRAASDALSLLQANYQAGLAAYVDVLTADVSFHQAVLSYLQAVAQRHQDTVALFVALGGGWWNAPGLATTESAR